MQNLGHTRAKFLLLWGKTEQEMVACFFFFTLKTHQEDALTYGTIMPPHTPNVTSSRQHSCLAFGEKKTVDKGERNVNTKNMIC